MKNTKLYRVTFGYNEWISGSGWGISDGEEAQIYAPGDYYDFSKDARAALQALANDFIESWISANETGDSDIIPNAASLIAYLQHDANDRRWIISVTEYADESEMKDDCFCEKKPVATVKIWESAVAADMLESYYSDDNEAVEAVTCRKERNSED